MNTPTRHGSPPSSDHGFRAFPMLLGLGERLSLSLLLSGVTFLGVAWALA